MRKARMLIVYMLQWPPDVSTGIGDLQVNKFEQVSSLGHQMSLAGGLCTRVAWPGLRPGRSLCSEVQGIVSNGHMGLLVNRQT